jgi:hypothetical protein
MSNPKGNPNIKQYGFKTDTEESLTALIVYESRPR